MLLKYYGHFYFKVVKEKINDSSSAKNTGSNKFDHLIDLQGGKQIADLKYEIKHLIWHTYLILDQKS